MPSLARIGFTCSKISACGTGEAPIFNVFVGSEPVELVPVEPQPPNNKAAPNTAVAAKPNNFFISYLLFFCVLT